ncbi:MAG: hypothetical protein LLG13_12650 [Bacteroidales bacterium]|nr:hypothetical protein [Bacteroidales bacterium]
MTIFKPSQTAINESLSQEIALIKSKNNNSKKGETTLAQQLLILHYLDFINQIHTSTVKKSFLLEKLLNRSKGNIKTDITYINGKKSKIKSRENLELVEDILRKSGLNEIADIVQVDLNKIKEK